MNYQDISKVNSEINMIDLKGKNYAMVPERVTAFRKLFPEGFIKTEIISHDGTTVLMQAVVGYYENGCPIILSSGFAQEVKGRGMVNGTSYIENCETSAVGRALGMIGLGINGGGICSAEELANAVTAQRQMKEEEQALCNPPIPKGGPVETGKKVPQTEKPAPIANYILNEITDIQEKVGIATYQEARKQVFSFAETLVESGAVPAFDWKTITLDEAKNLFTAIRKLLPDGDAA